MYGLCAGGTRVTQGTARGAGATRGSGAGVGVTRARRAGVEAGAEAVKPASERQYLKTGFSNSCNLNLICETITWPQITTLDFLFCRICKVDLAGWLTDAPLKTWTR